MPYMTIINGDQSGTQFQLGNRTLAIGRDPSRDIQVIDPKVSRRHAIVRHENDSYVIAGAKSLNGIQINGRQIDAEKTLDDGDVITLGDTNLRYHANDDADGPDAVLARRAADRAQRDANTIM